MRVVTWAAVDRIVQQDAPIPEPSDGQALGRRRPRRVSGR